VESFNASWCGGYVETRSIGANPLLDDYRDVLHLFFGREYEGAVH